MKAICIVSLLFIFLFPRASGQNTDFRKNYFNAYITTVDSIIKLNKCAISSFNEFSVNLSGFRNVNYLSGKEYIISELAFNDLQKLEFRKQGKISISTVYGLFSGVLIGSVIGFNTYVYHDHRFNKLYRAGRAYEYGMYGAIAGTVIGAGLGSIKISIPLENEKLAERTRILNKYSTKKAGNQRK